MAPLLPTITAGKVVFLHYTVRSDQGDLIDQSGAEEPMPYLHGAENIVPGLEKALDGRTVGTVLDIVIPPEDGYGVRQGPGPLPIPRTTFPEVDIQPMMPFVGEDAEGNRSVLWVTRVDDDTVFVDTNHPLSGLNLHFHVEVVAIRDATSEEMAHGHPHGRGSHEEP